jgi:hypothetical protein
VSQAQRQSCLHDFLNQNESKGMLIPNPNCEIRKIRIRTQHVQDKNLTKFYCKNETKRKQGCDKKKCIQN